MASQCFNGCQWQCRCSREPRPDPAALSDSKLPSASQLRDHLDSIKARLDRLEALLSPRLPKDA